MKIKTGQIWIPCDVTDYTLEILKITTRVVTLKQLETGEIYYHELDGSDGFEDYLEQNLYRLKT